MARLTADFRGSVHCQYVESRFLLFVPLTTFGEPSEAGLAPRRGGVQRGVLPPLRHPAEGSRAGRAICIRVGLSSWGVERSEEHTSELQSLMRISYAVFCLKKKTIQTHSTNMK